MSFTIYVTKDFDHMSQVAAAITQDIIKKKQASKQECVLGLATGNSPTGLYKHLAKAFNAGLIDAHTIRTFNLDEYIGLPGDNAQLRALHCKSYSYFMISELFGLMHSKFKETAVPYGCLIDQAELIAALASTPDDYAMQGSSRGRAVAIKAHATGILKEIKETVLDAYQQKITSAGGIDLQIIGVGGRGHVAFHESGIPFAGPQVLLVKLDDNTIANAVADGNFQSIEASPQYAISMGAELVYQAKTVLLVANGPRKTGPVTESVLGDITCEVPISYGQKYASEGGELIYVLDEAAAASLLDAQPRLHEKGYSLIDLRDKPYTKVEDISFSRNPENNLLG